MSKRRTKKKEQQDILNRYLPNLAIKGKNIQINHKKCFSFDIKQLLFIFSQNDSMSNSIADELLKEEKAIRPDVVSYIPSLKNFIFVESKIVTLGLKEVGQLLGYCAIAQPEEAFLITTKMYLIL